MHCFQRATLIVGIAWSAVALAQSPERSRTELPGPQVSQPKAGKQQQGASQQQPQQPIVVNVLPAPKAEAEREEEAKERREKAAMDAKLTQYTGELALFTERLFWATIVLGTATIGLFVVAVVQIFDNKKSIAAAQNAAEAAILANKLSIDIFNSENRPIISVKLEPDQDLVWSGGAAKTRVDVSLQNHGKSPARILLQEFRVIPATGAPPFRNLRDEMNDLLGIGARHFFSTDTSHAVVYLDAPWTFFQEIAIQAAEVAGATDVVVNILGCIWYGSIGGGTDYQAALTWQIGYAQPPSKAVGNRFAVGHDIPKDWLCGIRSLAGNFDRKVPEEEIGRQ